MWAVPASACPVLYIPGLSDLPIVGRLLFGQDLIFYISIALVIAVAWFLFRTKTGLTLRAIGDNPHSAHALGIKVIRYRYLRGPFRRRLRRACRRRISRSFTPRNG